MRYFRSLSIAIAATALAIVVPMRSASAKNCVQIFTVADLDKIRQDLAGNYCLASNMDFSAVANFTPIGDSAHPFTGSFGGRDLVIRGLTIRSGLSNVGLFGAIADGGSVFNLTLAGVTVRSTSASALVGAVVGEAFGTATIRDLHVTGVVTCVGDGCRVGGIAGQIGPGVTIALVAEAASVAGGNGGAAGGIAGESSGTIGRSYATGPVSCGSNCAVGGLVGQAETESIIAHSFATGPVQGADNGTAGGLAGTHYGTISQSYATGPVQGQSASTVASLIGYHGGKLTQSFAVGHVTAGSGSSTGGLIALLAPPLPTTGHSYWDLNTTGQGNSAQGQSLTTVQLQAAMPRGFGSVWGIAKGYSYPFIKLAYMVTGNQSPDTYRPFASTLATAVKTGKVFAFLPVDQAEPTEYRTPPSHAASASLATVYTMIARAVGVTHNLLALQQVKIDQFWDDATQTATWNGPATHYATLGSFIPLAPGDTINDSNIIGSLKSRNVVIVHAASGVWMLATLFTSDDFGVTTGLVVNSPFGGRQGIVDPANSGSLIDGYVVVTLN